MLWKGSALALGRRRVYPTCVVIARVPQLRRPAGDVMIRSVLLVSALERALKLAFQLDLAESERNRQILSDLRFYERLLEQFQQGDPLRPATCQPPDISAPEIPPGTPETAYPD